ncbi:hypothetical protein [Pedobacter sp.]|uniref:hypothetical protein n=1 Tax=Pedobacter sp. TaxID=1411316 RepID=UPI003C5A2CAE
MDRKEVPKLINAVEKSVINWARAHRCELIIGGIFGFSLTAAYLIFSKKHFKLAKPLKPLEPGLNMERYILEIPTDSGIKEAVVETSGECYGVTLDGKYIGSMWRDENLGLQWDTLDEELAPHVWDIASKLSEAFSRQGYPSLLKGAYPEIESTQWKSSETLEVVISKETDMEVFTTFLKDEVLNLVDFEEHLDLMVKKADDPYFVIIGIN